MASFGLEMVKTLFLNWHICISFKNIITELFKFWILITFNANDFRPQAANYGVAAILFKGIQNIQRRALMSAKFHLANIKHSLEWCYLTLTQKYGPFQDKRILDPPPCPTSSFLANISCRAYYWSNKKIHIIYSYSKELHFSFYLSDEGFRRYGRLKYLDNYQ